MKAREQAEVEKSKVAEAPKAVDAVALKPKEAPKAKSSFVSAKDSVRSKGSKQAKEKKRDKAARSPKSASAKAKPQSVPGNKKQMEEPRSDEEEEAGTILMGFLSSLRNSYEDALEKKAATGPSDASDTPSKKVKKRPRHEGVSSSKKQKLEQTPKISNGSFKSKKSQVDCDKKPKAASVAKKDNEKKKKLEPAILKKPHASATSSLEHSYRQFTSASLQNRRTAPAYITDMSTSTSETSSGNNSTNPVESSLEDSDSNSDKCGDANSEKGGKDNPSSSEEDDKMDVGEKRGDRFISKGPPRKRMKTKKVNDESTRNETAVEAVKQKATN